MDTLKYSTRTRIPFIQCEMSNFIQSTKNFESMKNPNLILKLTRMKRKMKKQFPNPIRTCRNLWKSKKTKMKRKKTLFMSDLQFLKYIFRTLMYELNPSLAKNQLLDQDL